MIRLFSILILVTALSSGAVAQSSGGADAAAAEQGLVLTLDDAIAIALERNYAVRTAALETLSAGAQVREAWGQVMPEVNLTSAYTRNVVSANPFAGSEAGGIFGALGAVDWLAFNENARTDGNPETQPISIEEFRRRQADGYSQAGVTLDPARNPFGVPNQFQSGISITQPLYSGVAFAAIRGARGLRDINEAALVQEQHRVVHETRQLFYSALLAQEQADVSRGAVRRASETKHETTRHVSAGTLPVLERLTAEVEVTNLETQLLQVENRVAAATSMLLFNLGLPVDVPVRLEGSLAASDRHMAETVSLSDAVAVAVEQRPEVAQARLAVHLNEVNRNITRAQGRPVVSAFANLNYLGNVPDDRTVVTQGRNPSDPFGVDVRQRGFFDSDYWNPTVAVGAQVRWNVFDGFQNRYRIQQNTIAIEQAQIALDRVIQAVVMEVDAAQRNMVSARQRIVAQRDNVGRAEMAYEFASARLATGVSSQLDVRMASGQLDQARLGYLQAVYDFLVARSELQRAMGVFLPDQAGAAEPRITTTAR
jgi:outer membrane protein TolC